MLTMACDADDMLDEEYERYADPIIDDAIANLQFDDEYHIVVGAFLNQCPISAGNSFLFSSSRVLYGLALRGQAPRFLTYCTKKGLPLAAVLCTGAFGFLAFMNVSSGAVTVFNWLVNVASVASLQSWAGMLFTYIRWHQGTVYYERKWARDESEDGKEARDQIEQIKKNRSWGQPYVRVFRALLWCGWDVSYGC